MQVFLGGLGQKPIDMSIDEFGIICTSVFCYGIPAIFTVLSLGLPGTGWYKSFQEDTKELFQMITSVGPVILSALENEGSIALCRSLGFREVGTYRRHAKLDGMWRDVVIVERLLGEAAD